MLSSVQNYVEYIVSAEKNIAIVGKKLVFFVFSCAFEENVHMSVAFYHFAFVFTAVLEYDFNVSVKLFDEHI